MQSYRFYNRRVRYDYPMVTLMAFVCYSYLGRSRFSKTNVTFSSGDGGTTPVWGVWLAENPRVIVMAVLNRMKEIL